MGRIASRVDGRTVEPVELDYRVSGKVTPVSERIITVGRGAG